MDHCDDDDDNNYNDASQSNSNSSPKKNTLPHSPSPPLFSIPIVTLTNRTSSGLADEHWQRQQQQQQQPQRSDQYAHNQHTHYAPHHHHYSSRSHPRHVVSANGLDTSPIRYSNTLLRLQQFMLGQWNLFQNQLEPPITFPGPSALQFRRHSDAAVDRQHGLMGVGSNYRRRGSSLASRQMAQHSSFDCDYWQPLVTGLDFRPPSKVSRRVKPGLSVSQRSIVVNVNSGRNVGGLIDRPPSITSSDRSDEKQQSSSESSPRRTPTTSTNVVVLKRPIAEPHVAGAGAVAMDLSTDDLVVDSEEVPVSLQTEFNDDDLVCNKPILPPPPPHSVNSPKSSFTANEPFSSDDARRCDVRPSTPVNPSITTPTLSNPVMDVKLKQTSCVVRRDSYNQCCKTNCTAPDQPLSVHLPSSPGIDTQKSIDRADTPTNSELYWTPDPPASPCTGIVVTVRPNCADEHDASYQHISPPHSSVSLVSACRPSLLIEPGSPSIHPASVGPARIEFLNDID